MNIFKLFKKVDINEGLKIYQKDHTAILLDVRTREEYRDGHLKNSINLPLAELNKISKIIKDKKQSIYIYCLSGSRANNAAMILESMGYENVYSIGGIANYQGAIIQ